MRASPCTSCRISRLIIFACIRPGCITKLSLGGGAGTGQGLPAVCLLKTHILHEMSQHTTTLSAMNCDENRSVHRLAHVISLDVNGMRFRSTAALLRHLGFVVRHFQPIPLDDPQVHRWAERFRLPSDAAVTGSPHSAISLSLSHLALWKTFPTRAQWLYIFEDDVMLAPRGISRLPPPYGRGSIHGVVTWEWPPNQAAMARAVRCLLCEVENIAEWDGIPNPNSTGYVSAPMIYLGGSGTHHHHSGVVSLSQRHTVRMCDSLDLHAYAVRRSFAPALAEQLLGRKEWREGRLHSLFRYNIDVMLRGFFGSRLWRPPFLHPSEHLPEPPNVTGWSNSTSTPLGNSSPSPHIMIQPLCVDMEEGGFVHQNVSLSPSVQHMGRGRLAWRRA